METSYYEHCQYSIRLIEKLKSLDTKNVLDFKLINKAIYWAKKYHGDQKRKSGEPYYSHPLEVAYMVSGYNLKTDVIVASILHDIIEDTEVTAGMILDNFSWRIAEMVDRLTRDRPDGSKLSIKEILDRAYQSEDEEVLIIKLFDRLHNVQTLDAMKPDKKIQTIEETLLYFISMSMYYNVTHVIINLGEICSSILSNARTQHSLSPKFSYCDFKLPSPNSNLLKCSMPNV
jgi:(p)ppGpp synthase/HD superfamily hydrolase